MLWAWMGLGDATILAKKSLRCVVMARKVILDVDPGVDDALALCFALFHPGWMWLP